MLKRGNLQNTIEKAKPNMQLINVIPLIHKVFLFLFQQLCHVVNQRIDKTNHEYKVNGVALYIGVFKLYLIFNCFNAAPVKFIKTCGIIVLLQEVLHIEIEG